MRWAHEHPEEYAEIAKLPPSQQNAALRHAIGYDPDRVRDEQKERSADPEQVRCEECGAWNRVEDAAPIQTCRLCDGVLEEGG